MPFQMRELNLRTKNTKMPIKHSRLPRLCCVAHNSCLLVRSNACWMLGRGNGSLWCQTTQRPLRLSPSQCGQCVRHLPRLIFLRLFFHNSVTMTAGWEGSCCHDGGPGAVLKNAGGSEESTKPRSDPRNNYDSQLLKNASHLNCSRPCGVPPPFKRRRTRMQTHICRRHCRQ